MKRAFVARLLGGAMVLLPAQVALAQTVPAPAPAGTPAAGPAESTGQGLEDIVVTARRQAESLQRVPVTVAAISSNELSKNLATDLSKIGELAPQVLIGQYITGSGAVITIRGISALPSDSGFDQSVALSIDGVPLSRGRIIGAAIFDTQQVEILEGPQALFFGKNSPAGVISIHTGDPTNRLEGYLRGGYEFEAAEKYVEGAISGPLTSNFKARLAFRTDWMNGWIRNTATAMADPFNPTVTVPGATSGNLSPAGHDYAARLTLAWTPGSDFEAKLKATYDTNDTNGTSGTSEAFCLPPTTVPVETGKVQTGADCAINRSKAESSLAPVYAVGHLYANNGVPYMHSRLGLISLALTKKFGELDLASTTGFYTQTIADAYSGDFSPFTEIYPAERESYSVITQELRLNSDFSGPLNFMVGAYFDHAWRDWGNAVDIFHAFDPVAKNYVTSFQQTHSINETYSAFAQLRWNILPTLELAGGARFTHDSRDTALVNTQVNLASATGRTLYPQGQVLRSRIGSDNWSPEATLTWHPTPSQTLYGAYKTGYKSGAISNAALLPATATADNVRVQPEKADGFEIGYKADLFHRTVRFNITGYDYTFKNLQVVFVDAATLLYHTGNAASSRSKGVTATLEWAATDKLKFNGNFGYNDAHYVSFPGAQCYSGQTAALGCVGGKQDLSGKTLARAPHWVFGAGADYKQPIADDWTATLSLSGAYSSSYQTAADYSPGGIQPSYWRLNASVNLATLADRLRFSVVGRNLTNAFYKVATFSQAGSGNPNQFVSIFNRPREVVLQAEYRF